MSTYQKACTNIFNLGRQSARWSAVLLCLLAQSPAFADAYLDALNSAADGLELDSKTTGEVSPAPSGENSAPSLPENMPAGLSQNGFEVFLQKRFFGSFAFYEKLNKEGKQDVFNAYGGKPNIDFVRDQIKRQYLRQ